MSLSVTTSTKILALLVSYVAYDSRLQNVQSDMISYQQYAPIKNLSYSINTVSIPRSIFHGITGFIIGNTYNSAISFDSIYNSQNNSLSFNVITNVQYLTYTYLFVTGN